MPSIVDGQRVEFGRTTVESSNSKARACDSCVECQMNPVPTRPLAGANHFGGRLWMPLSAWLATQAAKSAPAPERTINGRVCRCPHSGNNGAVVKHVTFR